METSNNDAKSPMYHCQICGKFLLFFFEGTRCKICGTLYSDYKFCESCVTGDENKIQDKVLEKLCAKCLSILEYSNKNYSEEVKLENPPDPFIHSKLVSDAVHIIESDPEAEYEIEKIIGSGSFGQVLQVQDLKTGKKFAAKVVKSGDEDYRELILNEYALTKLSRHANIIEYHLIYEYQSKIWIIQELMDCSLTKILDIKNPINEKYATYILYQVLQAISCIHKEFRIHRDIKSDNILMDLKGNIKLCDLGFATQLTTEINSRTSLTGSLAWIAPEVLNCENYGTKVDIWSFGILALEILQGEPPFLRMRYDQVKKYIQKSKIPIKNEDQYSNNMLKLIKDCLVICPDHRKTAEELINYQVFECQISKEKFSKFLAKRMQTI